MQKDTIIHTHTHLCIHLCTFKYLQQFVVFAIVVTEATTFAAAIQCYIRTYIFAGCSSDDDNDGVPMPMVMGPLIHTYIYPHVSV